VIAAGDGLSRRRDDGLLDRLHLLLLSLDVLTLRLELLVLLFDGARLLDLLSLERLDFLHEKPHLLLERFDVGCFGRLCRRDHACRHGAQQDGTQRARLTY
jgi:hypothetical protein